MINKKFIQAVKDIYATDEFIPLHIPQSLGNEKKYLNEMTDSTFVSSVVYFSWINLRN